MNNALTVGSLCFLLLVSPAIILVFHEPTYVALLTKNHADPAHTIPITKDVFSYFNTPSYTLPDTLYFSEDERVHLRDVKILIHSLLIAALLALSYLLYVVTTASLRAQTVQIASCATLLFFFLLAALPFDTVFTAFHQIFFAEGSWLFAPTSLLIQTYPFAFFSDFFTLILLTTIPANVLVLMLSTYRCRKTRRKL